MVTPAEFLVEAQHLAGGVIDKAIRPAVKRENGQRTGLHQHAHLPLGLAPQFGLLLHSAKCCNNRRRWFNWTTKKPVMAKPANATASRPSAPGDHSRGSNHSLRQAQNPASAKMWTAFKTLAESSTGTR